MPDIYEFHPIANHFPLMEEGELKKLAASIAKRGQKKDIILFEGKILDGRNRYRACLQAGVTPRFSDLGADENPALFAWDANVERLHYTPSQLAMAAAAILPIAEEYEKGRADSPEKDTPDKNPSECEGKQQKKQSANLRSIPGKRGKKGEGKRTEQAAATAGVSSRSIESAKKVRDKGIPSLAKLVEDDKTTVDVAAKVAVLPKEKQEEFVARIEAGNKARDVLREIMEEKPAKSVVLDPVGLAVPDKMLDVFAVREDFDEIEKLRRQLARRLDEVAHKTGGAWLARELKSTQQGEKITYKSTHLETLHAILKETQPHSSVCPWCHSKHPGRYERSCKACHGQGWVPFVVWRQTPQEEKEDVEKLAEKATQEAAS